MKIEFSNAEIILLASRALGENQNLHSNIDEIYATNKALFSQNAQAHPLYNSKLLHSSSFEIDFYSVKSFGILVTHFECQSNSILEKQILDLFKKAYKKIYHYIETQGSCVYFSDFMAQYLYEITDLDTEAFCARIGVLFILCKITGRQMIHDDPPSIQTLNLIRQSLEFALHPIIPLRDTALEKFSELKKVLKKTIGECRSISEFIVSDYYRQNFRYIPSSFFNFYKAACPDLSIEYLGRNPLTSHELEHILGAYVAHLTPKIENIKEFDEETLVERIITAITFCGYAKEYNKLKENLLETLAELDQFQDRKKLQEDLNQKNKQVDSLKMKIELEKKENAKKQNTINELYLQVQRLKKQIEKISKEKK